jgi:subtilase family serine protease
LILSTCSQPDVALNQQEGSNELKNALLCVKWHMAIALLAVTLVLSLSLISPFNGDTIHAAGTHGTGKPFTVVFKGSHFTYIQNGVQPPTDQQCRAQITVPCYSPQEIRRAYGVDSLLSHGFNGKGQTIVIIDSFGSPTIAADLHTFDISYNLPDPPSFKVYTPLGKMPFDPNNPTMLSWAAETTLDVEWAHAMAPDASIALMTSPTAETEGIQGLPPFLYLEKYALSHHLGNIISQSWGATENTLFTKEGRQVLNSFNAFYKEAAQKHVTVFASSGDSGVANVDIQGKIYPFPTVNFPASSPYVTAVGGTSLFADTHGNYQSQVAWSGSGSGVSQYFAEPGYERDNLNSSLQSTLKGYRGLPDIAYNADPSTAILIYLSFQPGQAGYYLIGGTSEGSPQWSGLIADGNQLAGHPLGFLNESLYEIGHSHDASEFYHDVTSGNNSAAGIRGYNAMPGWNLVTGWGSPKASNLLAQLIEMSR